MPLAVALGRRGGRGQQTRDVEAGEAGKAARLLVGGQAREGHQRRGEVDRAHQPLGRAPARKVGVRDDHRDIHLFRSEEHTSELQSLMRNSYAVFCLKKKNYKSTYYTNTSYSHHDNVLT